MKFIYILVPILMVVGCSNTGVVKLENDVYMISEKNAKIGFVSAVEEKVAVYQKANEFCDNKNKKLETVNLEMRDSGPLRQASATLEFRCIKRK